MSATTSIEWTDATWNPVTGCTEVSAGCERCYAKTFAERWRGIPGHYFENGFDVQLRPEKLGLPLRWRAPRRVFVNSMADLFHDAVPDEYIARVFAVMAATPQHTYQILTKRHARMRAFLRDECRCGSGHPPGAHLMSAMLWAAATHNRNRVPGLDHDVVHEATKGMTWGTVLPNVWLGVSVENQQWADIRIPALLDTPAAVRFLSCEPLLGPVDLGRLATPQGPVDALLGNGDHVRLPSGRVISMDNPRPLPRVDWVIVGGESGPAARPMHPDWARQIRDLCEFAGVPFLFKQWGEWAPTEARGLLLSARNTREVLVGPPLDDLGHRQIMRRLGKKHAGRELDGRTHTEFPDPAREIHR